MVCFIVHTAHANIKSHAPMPRKPDLTVQVIGKTALVHQINTVRIKPSDVCADFEKLWTQGTPEFCRRSFGRLPGFW